MDKILYVKQATERLPAYQQRTIIIERDGERLVRKEPFSEMSTKHIYAYVRNYEKLRQGLTEHAYFEIVPCKITDHDCVEFPFVDEMSISNKLMEMDIHSYSSEILRIRLLLEKSFGVEEFKFTEQFIYWFGDVVLTGDYQSLHITNLDLNFDNIFESKSGKFSIIDYEWVVDFPVPIEYMLFRVMMLDYTFQCFSNDEKKEVLKEVGITEEARVVFEEMETHYISKISPDEVRMDSFARIPEKKISDSVWVNEMLSENERLSAECRRISKELEGYRGFRNTLLFRGARKIIRKIRNG